MPFHILRIASSSRPFIHSLIDIKAVSIVLAPDSERHARNCAPHCHLIASIIPSWVFWFWNHAKSRKGVCESTGEQLEIEGAHQTQVLLPCLLEGLPRCQRLQMPQRIRVALEANANISCKPRLCNQWVFQRSEMAQAVDEWSWARWIEEPMNRIWKQSASIEWYYFHP